MPLSSSSDASQKHATGANSAKEAGERRRLSSGKHAIAGATSGVVARFFIAPIDVVKIRLQVGTTAGPAPKYRGLISTAKTIVAEEGMTALWKGNWSAELLYLGYGGSQFFFYDVVHRALREKLTPGAANFCSGAVAGAAATTLTYPLDLLRTRFALQGTTVVYRSLWQAVRSIYATENGVVGFYRGLGPALLQIVPYMGIMFQTYHGVRDAMNASLDERLGGPVAHQHRAWVDFFAGGFAGLISKLAVMPFDTVRKRLQCQFPSRSHLAVSNIPSYMGGFLSTSSQIIAQEGFLGLYKGTVPGLIKALPNSAITFTVYEAVRTFLDDDP
ncbi:mitochondrial deoxynucleotide carrier [Hyaloraphidium curvatum]|nr:mitochondrial deoxynucleotide carrier [Hyaloraphidium curvatum]